MDAAPCNFARTPTRPARKERPHPLISASWSFPRSRRRLLNSVLRQQLPQRRLREARSFRRTHWFLPAARTCPAPTRLISQGFRLARRRSLSWGNLRQMDSAPLALAAPWRLLLLERWTSTRADR